MRKSGTIKADDGVTYYHHLLWEALVQQNIEMGQDLAEIRKKLDGIIGERNAALRRINELNKELDFALQQLDDSVQRVVKFQQEHFEGL